MNVVEALAWLRQGLLTAGLRPDQVLVSMEMARPANRDSAPSASVYCVATRLRRDARKVRIPLSELNPAVEGAVGGVRHTLLSGLTWFEVLIEHRSMPELQNVLARFFEYLATATLVDAAGNTYSVLTQGEGQDRELVIQWNDHDAADRVTVTFQLPLPGIVWRDHPLIPVEIVVQYRREGGNPNE